MRTHVLKGSTDEIGDRVLRLLGQVFVGFCGVDGGTTQQSQNDPRQNIMDRPLILTQGKTFPYPLWISSTVDDSKDHDCRFLHQIENFVGEPLDEVSTKASIDGGKYQVAFALETETLHRPVRENHAPSLFVVFHTNETLRTGPVPLPGEQ
jgi:hypothetical protein